MKLVYSALLLLAAVSTCVAQSNSVSPQATPSLNPNLKVGIVGDEATSRAAVDVAPAAPNEELGKTTDRIKGNEIQAGSSLGHCARKSLLATVEANESKSVCAQVCFLSVRFYK